MLQPMAAAETADEASPEAVAGAGDYRPSPSMPGAGSLIGTTSASGGFSLAGVNVVLHGNGGLADRKLISNADGMFMARDLPAGSYQLNVSKEGFTAPQSLSVVVEPNRTSNANVELLAAKQALESSTQDGASQTLMAKATVPEDNAADKAAAPDQQTQQLLPPANAATGAAAVPKTAPAAPQGFWKRLGKAYWDDWHPGPDSGEAPKYRGYPMPVSNPPFPFSVWPIGGTVWIGYPNATSYPLTVALQNGPHGDWWKKANIQIYGWLDLGMNVSTSSARPYGNLPAAYAEIPNTFQVDQATMYIERVPDTVQRDHFDWGFRFTNLYGLDYRFTTAEGYFSQQLLNNPKSDGSIGNKMGYDPVMAYVDLYFPKIGEGTDVRIGRYISLPDIEAQLAPNNYTYTHSLTYTYDCYTQTGINMTTKWSSHWTTQVGLSGGCEAAPWAPDAKLTANACLGYTWTEGRDNIYTCVNSINDGKYNYNNLAAYYATWYHKFGKSNWHTAWEAWYQYMKDTPNVNNPAASSLLINNSNGAYCNNATDLTCFAPEWATVNYVSRQVGKKDALIFRNEYFDDIKGQRTGFKTRYTESGISWNHWIGTTLVFRPEVRFEHAYDSPAFNNGTKKSQLMFAADMIWFY